MLCTVEICFLITKRRYISTRCKVFLMTQMLSKASRTVIAIELGKDSDKNIFQQKIFCTSSSLRDCISRIDQLFLNLIGQNYISFASGMSHANDLRSRRPSVKHVSRLNNGTRSQYDLSIRSTPLYCRYRVSYVLSLSYVCQFKECKGNGLWPYV